MSKFDEVAVIGAGFVGTAHAVFLSKFYETVHLVDRDPNLVSTLAKGEIPFSSSDSRLIDLFGEKIRSNKIIPTNEVSAIKKADIVFVSVGLDFFHQSNGFENLEQLFLDVGNHAKNDCLIVFETTVPPGTSEKVVLPALKRSRAAEDVAYVYSYERVMPGPNYLQSIEDLPKVFAAESIQANKLYRDHLARVAPGVNHRLLKSIVSAELSKVLENSYRMMNIALVQEFAKFATTLGADLNGILECIRERPTHSNIRFTGLAPGGYCLTKDPKFLFTSAELNEIEFDFPMLSAAVKTVDEQNAFVIGFISGVVSRSDPADFLGLSYLPGVGDLRGSSSLSVYQALIDRDYSLTAIDSYVAGNIEDGLDVEIKGDRHSDIAILATAHPEFDFAFLSEYKKVVDINSCLNSDAKSALRAAGTTVLQYGE